MTDTSGKHPRPISRPLLRGTNGIAKILLWLCGSAGAGIGLLGTLGLHVPLSISVLIIWVVTFGFLVSGGGFAGLALLPRWMVILYFLPIAPLIENVFSDLPSYGSLMPMIFSLTTDTEVVQQVAAIAAVGLCAFVSGMSVARLTRRTSTKLRGDEGTVGALFFVTVMVSATALVLLTLPSTTIIQQAYSDVTSGEAKPLLDLRFSGAGFLVYMFLFAGLIDFDAERNRTRRTIKQVAWGLCFVALIGANALRGVRNPIGLVVAVFAWWLVRLHKHRRLTLRRALSLFAVASLVIVSASEMDNLRVHLATGMYQPFEGLAQWSYSQQAWMGATWSLFGLSDSFLSGTFSLQHGQTYLDYALSLPPSIIANAVGYQRPISDSVNPAWWFQGYTVGGMHPTVVPFANFGILGVLVVMTMVGWVIGRVEEFSSRDDFASQLFYGSAFVGSLFWFWYGDMYEIRAFMGAFSVLLVWKIMRKRLKSPQERSEVPTRKLLQVFPQAGQHQ